MHAQRALARPPHLLLRQNVIHGEVAHWRRPRRVSDCPPRSVPFHCAVRPRNRPPPPPPPLYAMCERRTATTVQRARVHRLFQTERPPPRLITAHQRAIAQYVFLGRHESRRHRPQKHTISPNAPPRARVVTTQLCMESAAAAASLADGAGLTEPLPQRVERLALALVREYLHRSGCTRSLALLYEELVALSDCGCDARR